MPPVRKKEVKEQVAYTFQKRKAVPFIPQRPSKAPRVESSSDSLVHIISSTTPRSPAPVSQAENSPEPSITKKVNDFRRPQVSQHLLKPAKKPALPDSPIDSLASDSDLDDNPLTVRRPPDKGKGKGKGKEKMKVVEKKVKNVSNRSKGAPKSTRPESPLLSDTPSLPSSPNLTRADNEDEIVDQTLTSPDETHDPRLTDPARIPGISQPLLLRILHEQFSSSATQIDQKAIVVFEKYIEIFVREAIARSAAAKAKDVEEGRAEVQDKGWLEVEDLEKVAAGLILDF